jgi:hypothetical protein
VTAGPRYALGLGLVTALGAVVVGTAPGARAGGWVGLGFAVVVEAPLGWWVLDAVGTERFMLVWALGMLIRLTALGLTALVAVPALGWRPAPVLLTLVGVLFALLVVEGTVAWQEHSNGTV